MTILQDLFEHIRENLKEKERKIINHFKIIFINLLPLSNSSKQIFLQTHIKVKPHCNKEKQSKTGAGLKHIYKIQLDYERGQWLKSQSKYRKTIATQDRKLAEMTIEMEKIFLDRDTTISLQRCEIERLKLENEYLKHKVTILGNP